MLALYKQNHAAREVEKNPLFKYFLSMFVGILPYNRPVTPYQGKEENCCIAIYGFLGLSVLRFSMCTPNFINVTKLTRLAKTNSLQSVHILVYMISTLFKS